MQITFDKADIVSVNDDDGTITIDIGSANIQKVLNRNTAKVGEIVCGSIIHLDKEDFIVLSHNRMTDTTKIISDSFLPESMEFGCDSNWKNSYLREYLNTKYYSQIVDVVGITNIIPMYRDLTSLDGLSDYGICEDKVSLLSVAQYAKYHELLGLGRKYSNWWWLLTPFSTPSNNHKTSVCCVSPIGTILTTNSLACVNVRPVINLKSSTIVSI